MLIYTGKGDFVANIPARDLRDEEVVAFGEERLLATGLYVQPISRKPVEIPAKSGRKKAGPIEELDSHGGET